MRRRRPRWPARSSKSTRRSATRSWQSRTRPWADSTAGMKTAGTFAPAVLTSLHRRFTATPASGPGTSLPRHSLFPRLGILADLDRYDVRPGRRRIAARGGRNGGLLRLLVHVPLAGVVAEDHFVFVDLFHV